MRKIVLASASPRRKELLENIGCKFSVVISDADESGIPKDLDPGTYVRELSLLKATQAAKYVDKNTLVIGADTVVESNGRILGKPKDKEEAFEMLRAMSGKTHYVYTGITVVDTGDMRAVSQYEKTAVTMREIPDREINHYINNFNVLDKAGAYGIQEYASVFVSRIEGDYFNIVGLPLCRLSEMISKEYGEDLV